MTTKIKAPCTSPDEIPCRGCGTVFDGTVALARLRGWRVGWQPSHPSWCSDCWKAPRPPKHGTGGGAQPYDTAMFDIEGVA